MKFVTRALAIISEVPVGALTLYLLGIIGISVIIYLALMMVLFLFTGSTVQALISLAGGAGVMLALLSWGATRQASPDNPSQYAFAAAAHTTMVFNIISAFWNIPIDVKDVTFWSSLMIFIKFLYLPAHILFGVFMGLMVVKASLLDLVKRDLKDEIESIKSDVASLSIIGKYKHEERICAVIDDRRSSAAIHGRLRSVFFEHADQITQEYANLVAAVYFDFNVCRRRNPKIGLTESHLKDLKYDPKADVFQLRVAWEQALWPVKHLCVTKAPPALRNYLESLSDADLLSTFARIYDFTRI